MASKSIENFVPLFQWCYYLQSTINNHFYPFIIISITINSIINNIINDQNQLQYFQYKSYVIYDNNNNSSINMKS